MLRIDNLLTGYGSLQVLWGVSMYVNPGEFIALVGPNGSGKSTLLRTIAGHIPAWGGDIYFNDTKINSLPAHLISRKGISYISESLNLFKKMSVFDNLLVGAFTIQDKSKVSRNLERILDLFPRLKDRKKQLAGTLSGGEQKMLAIARGLMSEPTLLMVDEPSLGLSPQVTHQVFVALERLHSEGVSILLVEQNVGMALEHANRGYVFEQGRVVLEGDNDELKCNENIQKLYLGG